LPKNAEGVSPQTVIKQNPEAIPIPTMLRTPSEIRFVRSRIFYSRPTFNSKKAVRLGLRHVHVFNRYTDVNNVDEGVHIMKYIFPRQFGLHNVFTSSVDPKETTQPFKDYTMREREIDQKSNKQKPNSKQKVPKRLRGAPIELIQAMRKAHSQISYVELLRHYCPTNMNKTEGTNSPLPDNYNTYASPSFQVGAFCKAVIKRLVRLSYWGDEEHGTHNQSIILNAIMDFISKRKFESTALQDVLCGIRVSAIPWLKPPELKGNMSRTDFEKRKELLAEFVYYLFDSILIPLIRSNFHVTESNNDKNLLYYFRLDVWQIITTPTLDELKNDMYEEIPTESVKKLLSIRKLGYSNVRLLPKVNSFRPIINLRRRPEYLHAGKRLLGPSINSMLTPVYKALQYEAVRYSSTCYDS
jgi:telomerase reverse transcriptase